MSTPDSQEPDAPLSAGAILACAIVLAVIVSALAVAGQWTYLMVAVVIGLPAMFMLLTVRKRNTEDS